ncbi:MULTISPECIES: co-regulatory protein PtrA N-terminal domain-containing protein [Pseudomonas]|uniref:co-regulatory protein PtrA N-terminal domain-containing protein n=1 Tax=Pseudomonas TaxID=286 RepID=UPI0013DE20CA|nr:MULTISPECIES: co-regulatory protein PtrA N-terminal domain-containing protein [Pseudomonas]UCL90255.1 hypothetical protein LDJ84_30240 [Pseudomonas sp. HS-18]
MKVKSVLLLVALLGSSSIALADGGGDITFARMEQARQQAMKSVQKEPAQVETAKN